MISARPITVLLRNPTAFGGLCERGTLRIWAAVSARRERAAHLALQRLRCHFP